MKVHFIMVQNRFMIALSSSLIEKKVKYYFIPVDFDSFAGIPTASYRYFS